MTDEQIVRAIRKANIALVNGLGEKTAADAFRASIQAEGMQRADIPYGYFSLNGGSAANEVDPKWQGSVDVFPLYANPRTDAEKDAALTDESLYSAAKEWGANKSCDQQLAFIDGFEAARAILAANKEKKMPVRAQESAGVPSDELIEKLAVQHIAPHAGKIGLPVPYQQTEQFKRVKAYTMAILAANIDRLNAEWMAKCEELRKFVDEITAGRIDPDKIAGKARSLVEMAKKEGA